MYAAQTGVAPPTFVFFTNVATTFHFSYQRYLENRLREEFGFEGTPIKLHVRARRGSKAFARFRRLQRFQGFQGSSFRRFAEANVVEEVQEVAVRNVRNYEREPGTLAILGTRK